MKKTQTILAQIRLRCVHGDLIKKRIERDAQVGEKPQRALIIVIPQMLRNAFIGLGDAACHTPFL